MDEYLDGGTSNKCFYGSDRQGYRTDFGCFGVFTSRSELVTRFIIGRVIFLQNGVYSIEKRDIFVKKELPRPGESYKLSQLNNRYSVARGSKRRGRRFTV